MPSKAETTPQDEQLDAPAVPQSPAEDEAPAAAEPTYQIGAYLLPAAIAAATKRRRRNGVDNARIAFDAIDAHRDELSSLRAARAAAAQRSSDSLFPSRGAASPRATAAAQGRRRLWALQATEAEIAVLDQLAEDHGYRARSELIAAAVETELLPQRRSSRRR
ncbi:hypothetical protein [Actinomadura sp. WAC 06369]|uniref:hypothetical protein n=1 Tax=Actinomadura sp. WAC 06369 TaxID=2203193 RepID=UPI000F7B7B2B|nr:hypothetical protein [Actinomadura sp. WAC 06369]